MAKTITITPQTSAQTNTQSWSTVADKKYTPTLTSAWADWSAITYTEGEIGWATTSETNYIHQITDDLVTKYV